MKVLLVWLVAAGVAGADERWHGDMSAGPALRINDPQAGVSAESELWPPGLWGFRGEILWLGGPLLFSGGFSRQLGGARPHLVLSFHGDGGLWISEDGLDALDLAGGLRTQLGISGPLVVVLDTSLHVAIGSGDPRVALVTRLGLGFAF